MVSVLRPGRRILNIPDIGVQTSRRAVAAGDNGMLNSLIAYWPGNEASGNLQDAHTNALHLTDTNTVTSEAGKVYATARQYTAGNNEYHTRSDNALLSVGDLDFTLAAWVYLDTFTTLHPIIAKYGSAGQRAFQISAFKTTNTLFLGLSSNGTAEGGVHASTFGTPPTGQWLFVVGWHDAGADTANIQINGGGIDSAAHSGGVYDDTSPFIIGSRPGSFWFNGRIGPVAMWKSAAGGGGVLTAAQRTALWNGGAGLAYSAFT